MGDAAGGLAMVLVLSSVIVAIALAMTGTDSAELDTIPMWAVTLLQVPTWVGFAGVPWWVSRAKGSGSLAADFGFGFRRSDIWVGLGAGLASQIVIGIVLIPLYDLLGIDTDEVGRTAEELADRADDPLSVVLLLLGAVVCAALFEELFFRGLLLRSVQHRAGPVAAVIVSSVVFGVIHFQPADTIALALFGAVCGTLAVRYGRLGPAVWAHVAFNLTAVISLLTS
jgi:membrane protease YdiL (CAAX protease family)